MSELTANGTCECTKVAKHEARLNKHKIKLWCINTLLHFRTATACLTMRSSTLLLKDFAGPGAVYQGMILNEKRSLVFDRYQVIVKSNNMTEFNDNACHSLQMNRTGQMCGSCVKGFAPPVYSYSLACVNCTDYKYNWIKYIAVAYLPLTVFFVIVITFRISAVSGAMNGFYFDKPDNSVTCCDGILSSKL